MRENVLSIDQAVKIVEDLLFATSNRLYDLKIPSKPLNPAPALAYAAITSEKSDFNILSSFLEEHPTTKFLRIQYLDYTATPRLRVVPIKRALSILQKQPHISVGITKASLGLLQNDTIIPGVTATGEYRMEAIFQSLRDGPSQHYATLQAEFRDDNNSEAELCPRSVLRRTLEKAKYFDLEFLVGFEIEIVFMSYFPDNDGTRAGYRPNPQSGGHAWNSAKALQGNEKLLTQICDALENAGIHLEQWHPEGATGQFEFVLPPSTTLEAVDTLLQARETISAVVASHGMRATLYPKPFPMQCGTASHVHISIQSPNGKRKEVYESFYAGILKHLRAVIALTYSNIASYERVADGCWAGGRWVTWGSQNRETPLRKVDDSHWEIKCLDGLANVYLAMAALIAAGVNGVFEKQALTWADCLKDPAELSLQERKQLGIEERLPADLNEALDALKSDTLLRSVLGEGVVERYCAVKIAEGKMLDGMQADERREWLIERY